MFENKFGRQRFAVNKFGRQLFAVAAVGTVVIALHLQVTNGVDALTLPGFNGTSYYVNNGTCNNTNTFFNGSGCETCTDCSAYWPDGYPVAGDTFGTGAGKHQGAPYEAATCQMNANTLLPDVRADATCSYCNLSSPTCNRYDNETGLTYEGSYWPGNRSEGCRCCDGYSKLGTSGDDRTAATGLWGAFTEGYWMRRIIPCGAKVTLD
jgi:hypothetical protein